MSAGYHECRKCKGDLQGCDGCKRNAGNVPLKPLVQTLEHKLRNALCSLALKQAFSQLVTV